MPNIVALQELDGFRKPIISFYFAFPDDQHAPPTSAQQPNITCIPPPVVENFILPKFHISLRLSSSEFARVPMPVTTIDKYCLVASWEDQVRCAGKSAFVKDVTIPLAMQGRPHDLLRGCISTANSGHKPTSLFRGQFVHDHTSVRMKSIVQDHPESDRTFGSVALKW